MKASRHRLLLHEKQDWIETRLRDFQPSDLSPAVAIPREIRELLKTIQDHLFDPRLTVAFARGRCHLRNNNISTRFRRLVGTGIRQYIEKQRMTAAAQLLNDCEIEIFLIAIAVGYEYQETFCRAFRRQFGCPPSTYRNQRKGDGVMSGPRLSQERRRILAAALDRILPSDDGPGAKEAGVIEYVEKRLFSLPREESRQRFEDGLDLLQSMAGSLHGNDFAAGSAAEREAVLDELRHIPHRLPRLFLVQLVEFSLEGFLGDPCHGGNRKGLGWSRIGFEKRPVPELGT